MRVSAELLRFPELDAPALAYEALVQATLGAEDPAALAIADRALSVAQTLRDEVQEPEIDLQLALLPLIREGTDMR